MMDSDPGARPAGWAEVDPPTTSVQDLVRRVQPGRTITGMSAVLLPFTDGGEVDWGSFEAHLARTVDAGLTPAVNMDTGFVQLIDAPTREAVLDRASAVAGANFVAGAFVADRAGDPFDADQYHRRVAEIAALGGTPIIFPSHGLNSLDPDGWVAALAAIGSDTDRFLGFELGAMFIPHGRIHPLEAFSGMMDIPGCVGAKHSSLSRTAEWARLALRDERRPDFMVLTGNDLAIDMVMYGSDYLLGLSTFAPEEFALRDRRWAAGDPSFHELNDALQGLGTFAFRDPVPGYRHDAAMTLQLRGWAPGSAIPTGAPARPESDRAVLATLVRRIEELR